MALAIGHVMLRESSVISRASIFTDYVRRIVRHADAGDARGALTVILCRQPSTLRIRPRGFRGQENNPEWKTVAFDEKAT